MQQHASPTPMVRTVHNAGCLTAGDTVRCHPHRSRHLARRAATLSLPSVKPPRGRVAQPYPQAPVTHFGRLLRPESVAAGLILTGTARGAPPCWLRKMGVFETGCSYGTKEKNSIYGVNNNIIYLFTTIGLSPGGSGYLTCKQNMKLVTTKFKSGGLHEKHVVATWNVGNRLSVCL